MYKYNSSILHQKARRVKFQAADVINKIKKRRKSAPLPHSYLVKLKRPIPFLIRLYQLFLQELRTLYQEK